jgi:hypothetical protein
MANQKYKIELTALDKTKKAFSSVKKGLGAVKSGAVGVTKVLGGATIAFTAVATTLTLIARSSFEFADAIGKVSTRTGLATSTVQAFQIAAVEAGVDIEVANKSLEKFSSSIGDAAKGLKTQRDILDDLGVELKNADGTFKSADEVLRAVSDGVSRLTSEFEKNSVGAALFGRAGRQIMDVLDDGGAAFDAYIQKAEAYGLMLSENSIRKTEKFNDTLALIKRQITVATAAISIGFLQILQDLSERFSLLFKDTVASGSSIEAFGEMVRTKFITGLKAGIQGVGNFAVEAQKAAIRLDILGLRFRSFGQSIMDFPFFLGVASLKDFSNAGTKLAEVLGFAGSSAVEFNDDIRRLEGELQNIKNPADAVIAFIEKYIDSLGAGEEANLTFIDSVKNFLNEIEKTGQTDQQSPYEVFSKQLEDTTKFIETNTVNAFKKAEDALVDFARTGEADFKSFTDSVIRDLIRLQIRMTIIKPFFDAFQTAGGFGKGGLREGFNALFGTSFDGGGFTGLGNRAGGIDGKGGFPAILHPNETVIDHTKGQQVAQAQPVSINFSIQATDAAGVDEIIASRKNQIVAMVSQAMNQRGKVGLV